MQKEFKTINEQIKILKSRNMHITNYKKAKKILTKNNYYYLINGYKNLFIDKNCLQEKYINNVKIDELYALYIFDRNIRIIFLKYILLIENEVNTYIAYEFSKVYGHKNYLVSQNFNDTKSNNLKIKDFIKNVNLEIQHQYKSSNRMIKHYIDKYNYIPLWVLIRILSFGKISKFYSLMKQKEQNTISRKYKLKTNEFKIMLHNLTLIRNICAHDEKLYDIKMRNRIYNTIYHEKLEIFCKSGNYVKGTRDLFSIVIILKILLENKEFEKFLKSIIKEIEKMSKSIKSIKLEKILSEMGFPTNYKDLLKL